LNASSSLNWVIKLFCFILFATVMGVILIYGYSSAREFSENVNDMRMVASASYKATSLNQGSVSVADALEELLDVSKANDTRNDNNPGNAVDSKKPLKINQSITSIRIIRTSTATVQGSSGKGGNRGVKRIIRF